MKIIDRVIVLAHHDLHLRPLLMLTGASSREKEKGLSEGFKVNPDDGDCFE
jgi:hypothetical protein